MSAVTDAPATVHQVLERAARAHPTLDCLCILPAAAQRYGIEPRTYTYAEVAREAERLASDYRAAGLAPGARAALLLENRPEMFFHWFALNALGVSVVPVHPEWKQAEIGYLIAHAEPAVAVAMPARIDELTLAACGRALRVTTPDLSGLRPLGSVARHEQPNRDTECALLYTSGTTGQPKACVLANDYFLRAGEWYAALGGLCRIDPGEERLLTPLPMSHMNAMAFSTLVMLLTGGCIVPLDRFHPQSWWASVREAQATLVHYLGVMPAILLAAARDPLEREHRVRFGFGAGVSPRLHAAFEDRFGFPLIEAWAMTETGAGAAIIAHREPRKVGTACFGRPQGVATRIVDEEGREVAPGVPGELLVRAAGADPRCGFFREYLKDAAATREAWRDGFFHTGDVVYRDEEGDLHFVDRRKNVIRRSGENISAVEVEGVLLQHPRVAAAAVTAVPDELRGEEVMACIVRRADPDSAGDAELAQSIQQFCLQRLAYYKAPGYVAFCERLPVTATAKIQRAELRQLGAERLAAAQCLDLRAGKKRGLG